MTESVIIAEGAKSPVTNPKINGLGEGQVHIVAMAEGYAPHIQQSTNENTPNVEDLSDPAVVYDRIKALPGITSFNPVDWLVGEWSSAYEENGVMIDEKFVFNADGSFQENHYHYKTGQELGYSGQWSVFTVENSDWDYLLLKTRDGRFLYYPVERDGDDAVRVILPRSSQMYTNAQLFVRLKPGSKTSVYPGRSILGVYGWETFEQDFVNISSKRFVHRLIIEAPNKATYRTFLNSNLQQESKGTWTLTPTDLILNLENDEDKYGLDIFNHRNLKLKLPDNKHVEMIKLGDTIKSYGADLFVGEFQNGGGPVDGVDRVSIVGLGNDQYRVDIHVILADYKNLKATKKQDGLLYVDIPDKTGSVVFKSVFNGLQVVKGPQFDNFMTGYVGAISNEKYFEKVSNKPLAELTDIKGWWRGRQDSVRLFDGGQYVIEQEGGSVDYGTYKVRPGKTTLNSICGVPREQGFPVKDNQLTFHSDRLISAVHSLNPIPGMKELGKSGEDLRNLIKRYGDDSLKNNILPLVPHPTIADAFVAKQDTEWEWSIASESAASRMTLKLKPNGKGEKSISGVQTGVYLSEKHLPNPDWHSRLETYVEEIDYQIISRGDKEYIIFNETGPYQAIVGGNLIEGSSPKPKARREILLFDGRKNICLQYTSDSPETLLEK